MDGRGCAGERRRQRAGDKALEAAAAGDSEPGTQVWGGQRSRGNNERARHPGHRDPEISTGDRRTEGLRKGRLGRDGERGRAPGRRRRKTVICSHPESQGPEAAGPGQDRTLPSASSLSVGTGPGVPSWLSRTSALSLGHRLCAWDVCGGLRASETWGSHSSPFSAKEASFSIKCTGWGKDAASALAGRSRAAVFATSLGFLFPPFSWHTAWGVAQFRAWL